MKKLIKIFYISIFFLITLTSLSQNTYSETAICEPDCHETPFIKNYPLSVEFTIGGCRYEVEYYIRKACDMWCDIAIWSVRSIDPPPCGSIDPNTMLNIATAQIIQHFVNNPSEWENITGGECCIPQGVGEHNLFWRVSKASCWKFHPSTSYNPELPPSSSNYYGVYGYCTYDICCLTWYDVVMDEYGQVIVTKVESMSPQPCPYDPSGQCVQVCD